MTTNTDIKVTYVVSRVELRNFEVRGSDGITQAGFQKWQDAEIFARGLALANSGEVIRLLPRTGKVAVHYVPRKMVTSYALRASTARLAADTVVNATTAEIGNDIDAIEDVAAEIGTHDVDSFSADAPTDAPSTETDLNALSTPELVARYNAVGGQITGKYKGARSALIAKIRNAA